MPDFSRPFTGLASIAPLRADSRFLQALDFPMSDRLAGLMVVLTIATTLTTARQGRPIPAPQPLTAGIYFRPVSRFELFSK